ncbi:MAG: hypothetical protein U1C33_03425, partial [Candidatus Cloacimonadaceae bacterium]|nr:hypothetical protein [Candidatus Cloacimonadaceae bacterium]
MLVYEIFTSEILSLLVMSYDTSGVANWSDAKQIFPQDSRYETLAATHAPGYGYYAILQSHATNPNAISLAVCNEAGDFIRHTTLDSCSSGGYSWV